MYFDGAVNIHDNGIVVVFISTVGAHFQVTMQLKFSFTNNIPKQEACITGLKMDLDMSIKDLEVFKDSILIISQPIREWEVRNLVLVK